MTGESALACVSTREQHLLSCRGWMRDRDGVEHYPGHPHRNTLCHSGGCGRKCNGCVRRFRPCLDFGLPRQAEHGLLCWSCWVKARDGISRMPDLVAHMRSIEASSSIETGVNASSAGFGSKWPLSESHITANLVYMDLAAAAVAYANDWDVDEPEWPAGEIADQFGGFGPHVTTTEVYTATRDLVDWLEPRLEQAATMINGATRIVELIQSMRSANSRFSLSEVSHMIPYMRCENCGHAQLRWNPPINAADEVNVKCERCDHAHSHDWYDSYLDTIRMTRANRPENVT